MRRGEPFCAVLAQYKLAQCGFGPRLLIQTCIGLCMPYSKLPRQGTNPDPGLSPIRHPGTRHMADPPTAAWIVSLV